MMCLINTICVYWWSGRKKEQETSTYRIFKIKIQGSMQRT